MVGRSSVGKRSFVVVIVVILALAALVVAMHTRSGAAKSFIHMLHGQR